MTRCSSITKETVICRKLLEKVVLFLENKPLTVIDCFQLIFIDYYNIMPQCVLFLPSECITYELTLMHIIKVPIT